MASEAYIPFIILKTNITILQFKCKKWFEKPITLDQDIWENIKLGCSLVWSDITKIFLANISAGEQSVDIITCPPPHPPTQQSAKHGNANLLEVEVMVDLLNLFTKDNYTSVTTFPHISSCEF